MPVVGAFSDFEVTPIIAITKTKVRITSTSTACHIFMPSALGINMWQAVLVEVILTFVFVIAIIGVTSKSENAPTTGIVIGLTLTLVHILGIPFTGTSVNPARSFGPALMMLFAGDSAPMAQVWVFILAPLVGGILAALVYKALASDDE